MLLSGVAQQYDNDLDVQVSVVADAIVVTTSGTSYSVTYRKRDEPWLLANGHFEPEPGPQPTIRRESLGGLYKDNFLGIGTK